MYFLGSLGHYIPIVQQGSSRGFAFSTVDSVLQVGLAVVAKSSIKELPVAPGKGGFVGGVLGKGVLSCCCCSVMLSSLIIIIIMIILALLLLRNLIIYEFEIDESKNFARLAG